MVTEAIVKLLCQYLACEENQGGRFNGYKSRGWEDKALFLE